MGRITQENHRKLLLSTSYEDADLSGMDMSDFSAELSQLISAKKTPIQDIVEITGLSKSYINKLRNLQGTHVQPSRSVILNIALALNATLEEMNSLLKAAHYQELYARSTPESIIIWGLLHNLSGREIRSTLFQRNTGLDILNLE